MSGRLVCARHEVPRYPNRCGPHCRGDLGTRLTPSRPTRARRVAAAIAVFLLATPTTVLAGYGEDSGRWWWDAVVGLGQTHGRNRLDGSETLGFQQNEVVLSSGLNGYVVHPLIASFRLQADVRLSNFSGAAGLDTDRMGLGFDLRGLPKGAYPYRVFFRRRSFDYSAAEEDAGLLPRGLPGAGTFWGGQMRARKGALRGLRVTMEHDTLDFLDPLSDPEMRDRQLVQWTRRGRRFHHNVRLEHRRIDFGRILLVTDDKILRVDERGNISPKWWWEMTVDAIDRTSAVDDRPPVDTEDYRLFNRFRRSMQRNGFLDFAVRLGTFRSGTTSTQNHQDFAVLYRYRPNDQWELVPFGRITHRSADEFELSAPRAGIVATWTKKLGPLDTLLSPRASLGDFDRRTVDENTGDLNIELGFNGSLFHVHGESARESFEFEFARNELRFERLRVVEIPGLDLPVRGLDAENFYRLRGSIDRTWGPRRIHGWLEWRRSESADESQVLDVDRQFYTGGFDTTLGEWTLRADAGQTEHGFSTGRDQTLRYVGAAATWRPVAYLRFTGVYRMDRRENLLGPDIDGHWLDAESQLQFGRLAFNLRAWQRITGIAQGQERNNRGVSWNVSSRFAGWLPFVTGTKRRGVIR